MTCKLNSFIFHNILFPWKQVIILVGVFCNNSLYHKVLPYHYLTWPCSWVGISYHTNRSTLQSWVKDWSFRHMFCFVSTIAFFFIKHIGILCFHWCIQPHFFFAKHLFSRHIFPQLMETFYSIIKYLSVMENNKNTWKTINLNLTTQKKSIQ